MTLRIRIELDALSGRPNPSWTLDEADTQAVLARLRLGPPCAPRSDHLGYRGFLVWRNDRMAAAGPWLRVGHGIITELGRGTVAHRDDGQLEDLFIEQAAARGFAPLVGRSGS